MSTNSSTVSNTSSHLSLSSVFDYLHFCWSTSIGTVSITVQAVFNNLVLLPLCLAVLCLGLKRWRRLSTGTPLSHSDVFTYHIVILELMNVLGSTLTCLGIHTNNIFIEVIGICLFTNVFSGQMIFHILTCLERYLAVIHPVTYLALKSAKGIRMRNFTLAGVWVTCLAGMGYLSLPDQRILIILSFCLVPTALLIISFCSVSVLCALIRPGPGRRGVSMQQADPTKRRAFHTIVAILSVLLVRFGGHICVTALYDPQDVKHGNTCSIWLSGFWFSLPSSLLLPLLFLHRARKKLTLNPKRITFYAPKT